MVEQPTLSRPYAKAIFEIAKDEGRIKQWNETLHLLDALSHQPEVKQLLKNPGIDKTDIAMLLVEVLDGKLDQEGKNLVQLLVANHRFELTFEITRQFEKLCTEEDGKVEANVISTMPLTGKELEAVKKALHAYFGREVILKTREDPSLMGGMVIRAGDLVIDGSIRGRLAQLAQAMSL